MLADNPAVATLPVKNLGKARKFYSDKLGLKLASEQPGVLTFLSGPSKVFVYQSEFAGTNKATAATWAVSDIEAVVADLRKRGVVFEHYTHLPGLTVEGDLHVGGGMKAAWPASPQVKRRGLRGWNADRPGSPSGHHD